MYPCPNKPESIFLATMEAGLKKIYNRYVKVGEIELDEEYNGFAGTEFVPHNLDEVINILNKDKEFSEKALFHFQIDLAAKFLNVKLGNIDYTIKRFEDAREQIMQFEAKYGKNPCPGINTSLLWDIKKNAKNSDEVELLCALTAIRSIIGQRSYTATTKSIIAMRMIGAKSKSALEECLTNKELRNIYEKYSKRYQMDKMIGKLKTRKFIPSKISIGRKIFISTTLNMQELENAIIEFRKKRNHKKQESEARQRILLSTI